VTASSSEYLLIERLKKLLLCWVTFGNSFVDNLLSLECLAENIEVHRPEKSSAMTHVIANVIIVVIGGGV